VYTVATVAELKCRALSTISEVSWYIANNLHISFYLSFTIFCKQQKIAYNLAFHLKNSNVLVFIFV